MPKKRLLLFINVILVIGFSGIASASVSDNSATNSAISNELSQTILVTYADKSIERKSTITGSNRYRSRGGYSTTAWGRRIAGEVSSKYHLKLLSQWPITELGIYCVEYRVPSSNDVGTILAELQADTRIESAQAMNQFRTMAHIYNDPYYRLQNNIQLMRVEAAHRYATGKNIEIVVIDTGIENHHPDLLGQVVASEDFSSTGNTVSTGMLNTHGTAVAGVIGAVADNGKGIVGIAPEAKLIALKACTTSQGKTLEAVCNSLTLAQALNAAIRMKPDIINLSLGGPTDPLLRRLINRALDDGIIIIAAASAEADDGVGFPASMERVIAVSDGRDSDTVSQQNTVIAPGHEILTTIPNASYEYISGSSISAATVSGLVALLLQMEPRLQFEKIAFYLESATVEDKKNSTLVVDACGLLAQLHADSAQAKNAQAPFDCALATK